MILPTIFINLTWTKLSSGQYAGLFMGCPQMPYPVPFSALGAVLYPVLWLIVFTSVWNSLPGKLLFIFQGSAYWYEALADSSTLYLVELNCFILCTSLKSHRIFRYSISYNVSKLYLCKYPSCEVFKARTFICFCGWHFNWYMVVT